MVRQENHHELKGSLSSELYGVKIGLNIPHLYRERKWSSTSRYYLEVPTSCPLSENEGIVHYLVGHKCPVLTKDAPTNLSPEIRKTAEVWPVHLHFQNWPRLKAQPLFPYDTWDPPLYSPIHTPFLAHMMIPNIHRQVWTLPTPSAISNPTGGWKQWHMPIIPAREV